MTINDRFNRGFWAGLTAGIIISLLNFLLYLINFMDRLYLDWAAIFIFSSLPQTAGEAIIAQLGQWFFSAFMGIIFVYLLSLFGDAYHLFKGTVFGLLVWFSTSVVVVFADAQELLPNNTATAAFYFLGAVIFGLGLGFFCRLWEP